MLDRERDSGKKFELLMHVIAALDESTRVARMCGLGDATLNSWRTEKAAHTGCRR